ncbi:hypothetical protein RQM65_06385 [Pricia sp. S334]|uniref:Transposase n=1 Tax=Pricia mediterranea TaxID=3076079 RepID=A0ABU3L2M4_9FLAO|nr:hypothetical protein [Pricia sp. S334]MDT7827672.1 hypothetical protein [Pricia sp. S334]MDT7828285.1 hypothetical protein [Pricia sp. S334]
MSKEQEMFALIDEFENGVLSGKDFCRAKGLVPSTFYYWKKKKARIDTGSSTGFVTIGPNPLMDGNLELIYPNGIRLRLGASQFTLIGKLLRLY